MLNIGKSILYKIYIIYKNIAYNVCEEKKMVSIM